MPPTETLEAFLAQHETIECPLGTIVFDKPLGKSLGKGGNGAVYAATLHGTPVAIKFLVVDWDVERIKRFTAEYWNTVVLPPNSFVAAALHFGELKIGRRTFPMIVMRRYASSLKRPGGAGPTFDDLDRLFRFLVDALHFIHTNGVIHRDLKPDNILVNGDSYVLADFGIAAYHPELFELRARTHTDERVANFEFSAPEQVKKGIAPHETMDVYALGQICQWYVMGNIHRGTGRKRLTDSIPKATIIDEVVERCLANNAEERFKSAQEIRDYVAAAQRKRPIDYLHTFRDALAQAFPRHRDGWMNVTSPKDIERMMECLAKRDFEGHLRWCNGPHQAPARLLHLGAEYWLIGNREVRVRSAIVHTTPTMTEDFVLLVNDRMSPFFDNGAAGTTEAVAAWYNDPNTPGNGRYITMSEYENGYAFTGDGSHPIDSSHASVRERSLVPSMFFLATNYHSVCVSSNEQTVANLITSVGLGQTLPDSGMMNAVSTVFRQKFLRELGWNQHLALDDAGR